MAAKKSSNNKQKNAKNDSKQKTNDNMMSKEEIDSQINALPKEMKEYVEKNRPDIDKLREKIVTKFEDYIMGVAILPPVPENKQEQDSKEKPKVSDKINTLVLVDDSDSKKMTKEELKEKLSAIINSMAAEINKKLAIETVLLSELWQSCYDQKFDIVNMVSLSVPLYDKGVLSGVKISEVHKRMVIKKFEKYIVSYCIAGAFTKGRITKDSDIDVYVVIDDTDVKKMTRVELKDKLRAIIISMGFDAKQFTGVNREFHIQVYILTDFWDSLKEAHPVIFDLLRDGVPLFDRGIFMPWKQLLRMGKIRPSDEAIEMFMSSGEQIQKRISYKLREIAMEDIFLSIQTPSQAALMTYGLPPPAPKETPKVMENVFVKKEKILEQKYVDILKEIIKTRKDIEHGKLKEVSGKQIDDLLAKGKDYLKRINELFKVLDEKKNLESIDELHQKAVTSVRDAVLLEGADSVKEEELENSLKEKLTDTGKMPQTVLNVFSKIMKAKKEFDQGKLAKNDIVKLKKDFGTFIKMIVEYMQRKRASEINRSKIRIKYGDQFGEVVLLGKTAYIIHDIDAEEREVSKANLKEDGSLGKISKSSLQDLEEEYSKDLMIEKVFVKEKLFESLKNVFGKDIEILLN